MGLLSGLFGNASEVDCNKLQQEYSELFIPGEEVLQGFKVIRDTFIFTDKRLLLVDKQGMTGKKVEYLSIPYRSISRFSIETAGTFDMDSELKIWLGSSEVPLCKQLKKGTDIIGIQRTLAAKAL